MKIQLDASTIYFQNTTVLAAITALSVVKRLKQSMNKIRRVSLILSIIVSYKFSECLEYIRNGTKSTIIIMGITGSSH